MWIEIKKILPFAINKLRLGNWLEFNQLSLNWDKILSASFGDNWKNKAKPISLKDKILIVDCLNSSWASEFQLKKEKIINQINHFFCREIVKEIKFIS